jgi:hypothetical protein
VRLAFDALGEARKSMRQDGGKEISESADSSKLQEYILSSGNGSKNVQRKIISLKLFKETVVQHQIIETVLKFISLV